MRIRDLFQKDIFRPVNGVVKADQLDESSVWQELEEFVVTRELNLYLERFFTSYVQAMDRTGDSDVAGSIGVWVSGFFGSGKSHFIKVLSYLLANEDHTFDGQTRRAVDFFEPKIKDAMLRGDIQRAVASNTDVILFNIDSKADNRYGRDAILSVFLKVLNEKAGYSGDYPHIAHMERYLASRGELKAFQDAFQTLTGTKWFDERDTYEFHRDEVVEALTQTLGQSKESCQKWIDGAEESFALTVENFCKWVKAFLDYQGPDHRVVFLVDEVGQFIGTDTHLMLNLQTITEELGTVCEGRAWAVVTSQEDIDAVLGEIQGTRANDFSKIQGRFRTRISLSSANVDEVIQERLLAKREDVNALLLAEYDRERDILKNQLSFKDLGTTFPPIQDAQDFARNYPFAPYQFKLLQKIFESIRKAGAIGLHLAQGERSLLDAFQHAAQAVSELEVGILVPLYLFYPSIESFLDTAVKRTIDQARDNRSLEDFDVRLLEVLFLIRYVDEVKGNVENLVTLCLDQIDADRLTLRNSIETSLQRLESQTLVNRSGDVYFFLTSEERDISREIKNVELSSSEEASFLGELIFSDVLRDQRKHRLTFNKMDFSFNRICDGHLVGNRTEGALVVSAITPLADEYELYGDSRCVLESSQDEGQVLIRLQEGEGLGRELRMHLRTDKYNRTRDDSTLPSTTKRILRDLGDENRIRREGLIRLLGEMLTSANFYVAGQRLELASSAPQAGLSEAMEYLIQNTFTKMRYLNTLRDEPRKEIEAVLRINSMGQHSLDMALQEESPLAAKDIRDFIDLCKRTNKQIVLHEMVSVRYANRPYGWPQLEVVLLLARLYMAGEVQFVSGGAVIPREKLYEAFSTPRSWRSITVIQRAVSKPEDVKKARELGRELFSVMGPESEEPLFEFLKDQLNIWREKLDQYRAWNDTGIYPGAEEVAVGLSLVKKLLAPEEGSKFLQWFIEHGSSLMEFSDTIRDLDHFYQYQRPIWNKLRSTLSRFELNQLELERDDGARNSLQRMGEILNAPSPYGMIKEAEDLIRAVSDLNDELLSEGRTRVIQSITEQIEFVNREIVAVGQTNALLPLILTPLESLKKQVRVQESLAHISQAELEAVKMRDKAMDRLEQELVIKGIQDIPATRPRRTISPKSFVKKPYLETQEDVETFLNELRVELASALAKNERIEIL